MRRAVEIEDTLEERVDSAIEEVEEVLKDYLAENPDTDDVPCINKDLDYDGRIHEIVDGSVPIYTKEIEDTWYLYASKLEEAYENAGVGDNPRENDGMAAIYFYIMDKVQEWYQNNAEDIFDAWKESKTEDDSEDAPDYKPEKENS